MLNIKEPTINIGIDDLTKELISCKNSINNKEFQTVSICLYIEGVGHIFPVITSVGFNEGGAIIDAKISKQDLDFVKKYI